MNATEKKLYFKMVNTKVLGYSRRYSLNFGTNSKFVHIDIFSHMIFNSLKTIIKNNNYDKYIYILSIY